MSLICHSDQPKRFAGRVIDLERVRVEPLANEIADQLVVGQGSVLRLREAVENVDRW